MSLIGFGSGKSSEEDERPVLTGQSDKKAWITGLTDYVNSMKEICPGYSHSSIGWLLVDFSMTSMNQIRNITAPPSKTALPSLGKW